MHLLFVCSILGPTIGGIETLISRMCKWLIREEHTVTLLCNSCDRFRELFPAQVRIIDVGAKLKKFSYFYKAKAEWSSLGIENVDVIKSFHIRDSWISTILASFMIPKPKVIFGNYFPAHFPATRNPFKHLSHRPYLMNLSRHFSDNSIMCMDQEQIVQFQRQYGLQRKPLFWPLPIEKPNQASGKRAPKLGKIVSVNRLEPMKDFVFNMIDTVGKLRLKGYPVSWTVFGEGSFEKKMRERIAGLGLSEFIELKGRLEYKRFGEIMHDAYVFVGGGTAIVEAALCGVATVMPFAYDISGGTYGPLYKLPFGNLGVRVKGLTEKRIEGELERLLGLTEYQYEKEVRKNMEYASQYSMDKGMMRLVTIAKEASVPEISYTLFYYYYAHSVLTYACERLG